MSLLTARRLLAIGLMAGALVACGKKGPPLAPFPRVPGKVDNLSPSRIGDEVFLTFPVPSANIDGRKPADLEQLQIFAITTTRAPETEEERKAAALVGTLAVRAVLPPPPPPKDGETLPVLPDTRPGLDQGAQALFTETLTDVLRTPVELPTKKPTVLPPPVVEPDEPPIGPLVAPQDKETARRYYFVVPVSPRGRKGPPSAVVSVPFGNPSSAPGVPKIDYTETTMTIRWEPAADAKTWTIAPVVPLPPAPPKPVALPGEPVPEPSVQAAPLPSTQPAPLAPPAPPAPIALSAKSLGFTTQATLYNVYEIPSPSAKGVAPPASAVPKPMTPQPLAVTEFVLKSVAFGQERCFAIRPVDTIWGMPVQGPVSPVSCVTPRDTFAPQAPRSLAAIAGGGVINLIWDANTESDLAGYIVLRGEVPGDTLQPLTPLPIRETTFRDTTVQPGVRYVYAVVALDNAVPANSSPRSNRTEETARQ